MIAVFVVAPVCILLWLFHSLCARRLLEERFANESGEAAAAWPTSAIWAGMGLLAVVPLVHPRKDPWERHFEADASSGEIRGLTALGRATVARLDMKSQLQLTARLHWMRLGLFP